MNFGNGKLRLNATFYAQFYYCPIKTSNTLAANAKGLLGFFNYMHEMEVSNMLKRTQKYKDRDSDKITGLPIFV